jgi:hypothetical protein
MWFNRIQLNELIVCVQVIKLVDLVRHSEIFHAKISYKLETSLRKCANPATVASCNWESCKCLWSFFSKWWIYQFLYVSNEHLLSAPSHFSVGRRELVCLRFRTIHARVYWWLTTRLINGQWSIASYCCHHYFQTGKSSVMLQLHFRVTVYTCAMVTVR